MNSATVDLNDGASQTVTWKVTTTKTSTYSAKVTGTVTVANPNPIGLNVNLNDTYYGHPAAFSNCSGSLTPLAAGATVTCDYTIDLGDNSDPSDGINTLNASVADPYGDLSNSGSAGVTFPADPHDTGEVDEVDITDTNGHQWDNKTSGESISYEQQLDCSQVTYDQQGHATYTITNTADIVQTNDEDSASVQVNCTLPLNPLVGHQGRRGFVRQDDHLDDRQVGRRDERRPRRQRQPGRQLRRHGRQVHAVLRYLR